MTFLSPLNHINIKPQHPKNNIIMSSLRASISMSVYLSIISRAMTTNYQEADHRNTQFEQNNNQGRHKKYNMMDFQKQRSFKNRFKNSKTHQMRISFQKQQKVSYDGMHVNPILPQKWKSTLQFQMRVITNIQLRCNHQQ